MTLMLVESLLSGMDPYQVVLLPTLLTMLQCFSTETTVYHIWMLKGALCISNRTLRGYYKALAFDALGMRMGWLSGQRVRLWFSLTASRWLCKALLIKSIETQSMYLTHNKKRVFC